MREEWTGFSNGAWTSEVNVRDFIQKNYTPYDGDASFLAGPTQNTTDLWNQVLDLQKKEREAGGVLDMDTKVVQTITSHGAGYLDKDKETIVGFQTDKPFKRGLQVNGGIRMAMKACSDNGYEVDPEVVDFYTNYRKTHNAGVFDAANTSFSIVSLLTESVLNFLTLLLVLIHSKVSIYKPPCMLFLWQNAFFLLVSSIKSTTKTHNVSTNRD